MDVVTLLILALVFACVAWGGFWVCDRAGFPLPVKWIWGGVCLLVLVGFLAERVGGGGWLHRPL